MDIYRITDREARKWIWDVFKKYHYLDHHLHPASEMWIGMIGDELVCHTGVIQFPMRKGWKRIHRLVTLPDYQGIGIGTRFINEISQYYINEGWEVNLTTTTPSLVGALTRSQLWILKRFGRVGSFSDTFKKIGLGKASSKNRITYSFNFKHEKKKGAIIQKKAVPKKKAKKDGKRK